jgi:antitoxin component YwqK of YwqJK toxin-antitoxin module
MRLRGVVLLFFLMVGGSLYSQKDTIWFDAEWKVQAKDSAAFYRISEHKEVRFKDFYHFTDYAQDGLKLKMGVSLEEKTDKFEGEVVYYNDGAYIRERILFRNGSPYGSHKIYYNSGRLKSVKTYNFGVLTGPSKVYYEDGVLKESGAYANNERNGEWKVYYPNRKLKEQGHYHDGVRVGVWKVYYYNGSSQE